MPLKLSCIIVSGVKSDCQLVGACAHLVRLIKLLPNTVARKEVMNLKRKRALKATTIRVRGTKLNVLTWMTVSGRLAF